MFVEQEHNDVVRGAVLIQQQTRGLSPGCEVVGEGMEAHAAATTYRAQRGDVDGLNRTEAAAKSFIVGFWWCQRQGG